MTSVTLCIPAYEAAEFIRPAIESALAQTHEDVQVLIGVDRSTDDTIEVCREYAGDPRVTLVAHQERRGWVGNSNSLLDRVDTEYFAFVFHDDHVDPRYCEVLVDLLERHPDAVLASGALAFDSGPVGERQLLDLRGDVAQRFTRALTETNVMYSMKSMARSWPLHRGIRLREEGDLYHADLPFFLRQLALGEAVAVPEPLYHKQIWDGSVTGAWRRLDPDDLFNRKVETLAEVQQVVAGLDIPAGDRRVLHGLALTLRGFEAVTDQKEPDAAVVQHELAMVAAVVTRLLDDRPSTAVRRSSREEVLARGLGAVRRRLALVAQDRQASDEVVAALHVIARATGDHTASMGHADHIRAGRALLRGVNAPGLFAQILEHAETVLETLPNDGDALILAVHATAGLRRWRDADRYLHRLDASRVDPQALTALRQRIAHGIED